MYNTYNYNTNVYDNLFAFPEITDQDSIIFNDYSLQDPTNITTQELNQDSPSTRDFKTTAVPANHGEIINGDYWRRKIIKLKGVITKSTNALLEAEIDAMKRALSKRDGVLDIKIDGVIRRYVATQINTQNMFQRRRGYHVSMCPYDIQFVCLDPFGKDVNYTSVQHFDLTTLLLEEEMNNAGSAPAQPVVILNFTAVDSISAVKFENVDTSESITLNTTVSVGDIIRFDSENKEVKKNGVIVDYDGSFPRLDAGLNSVAVTLTGTSATYSTTLKHKNSFL